MRASRVDAAHEPVIAHREPGHRDPATRWNVLRARTFRSGYQPFVQRRVRNVPAAERRYLGEGVRTPAFVPDAYVLAFRDLQIRRVIAPRLVADDRGGEGRIVLPEKLGERHVTALQCAAAHFSPGGVSRITIVPHCDALRPGVVVRAAGGSRR